MLVRTARDVGKLIRAARKAKGWTQARLAGELGSTQKWVSQIENGRPGADLDRVLRALSLLGVILDARLPGYSRGGSGKEPYGLVNKVADRPLKTRYGNHGGE